MVILLINKNMLSEPVEGSAYILGEPNSTVVATLHQPATLRCAAGGHPKPFVTWWRGDKILPLKDENFEITRDYSIIISRVTILDLGPYVCQAYNSIGRPVTVQVTLKCRGPLHATNDEERRFLVYEDNEVVPTVPTYRQPPRPRPTISIGHPPVHENVPPQTNVDQYIGEGL